MMLRWTFFGCVVLAVSGSLIYSEIRKAEARVGPEPILDLVADTERELSRLPVKFAPLADEDEIKIGKELEKQNAAGWLRAGEADRDRAIEAYVQQVGARVAKNAHRKLPYRFHYLPGLDFVNAFALPGGPVYIGGGLLALMNTEDELAAVLGHELEHIDHYHCAERFQIQAALQRIPLGELVGLPVEVFVAGYSKNQELEADREGTKLAAAALYSPEGAIQMFRAFERAMPAESTRSDTPGEELSRVALQTLLGYFQSHPPNAERIDQIQKMIASGQLPGWKNTRPMVFAYVFLAERAWRLLEVAKPPPSLLLAYKEKQKRGAERVKQFREAIQLASQALALQADEPRALEIVAVANLGLGDYEAARSAYFKLLPAAPTFADGIRIYADSMARDALGSRHYETARQLATLSLEWQSNQPDALTILVEAQLHLRDLQAAAETATKLRNLDTRAATEASVYAASLASASLFALHYQEAADLAALALELDAHEWDAVTTLAKAKFALAEFSAARDAYLKLLERDATDMSVVRHLADAISASDAGAPEIKEWFERVVLRDPTMAIQVRIERTGLLLMRGDDQDARNLISEGLGRNLGAAELLGRLGWWYYRAGNYGMSSELLLRAVAQRPGNLSLHSALAFDQLELRQLDDAARHFSIAIGDTWNSPLMGRAVARWQLRQSDDALKDFEAVVKIQPEWLNARWVAALYSPAVVKGVAEMQAEWRKRAIASR